MKIVMIHSAYSRKNPSGENIVVEEQSKLLSEHGHDVFHFTVETDSEKTKSFYAFSKGVGVAFGFGKNPIKFLEEIQPDLTVIHNLFPNISENWIMKWNGPTMQFLHNFRRFCANGLFFRNNQICTDCVRISPILGLVHRCYRNSYTASLPLVIRQELRDQVPIMMNHKFVVLSEQSEELFFSSGIPREKMHVIPNFVANGSVDSDSAEYEKIEKNGIWIYSGRLEAGKGILELARSWPDTFKLDIFGSGSQMDELISICLNRPNIRIMGFINRGEYLQLLSNYSGAVLPSNSYESSPLSCIEFLSVGLPVISHQNNSMSRYISKFKAGEIFGKFDTTELRESLTAVTSELSLYEKNSKLLYEGVFSTKSWLSNFFSLAKELGVNPSSI